jgi:hypothetical protein
MTAFVANTNLLELIGLKSAIEDAFINNATVSVTVKDAAGTNVAGVTWPVALAYVADSSGDYRAVIPHGAALVSGRQYTAEISADAGADRIGFWRFVFRPLDRA